MKKVILILFFAVSIYSQGIFYVNPAPVTTTQLNLKADLASPTFTGTVVLPATTSIGTVSNTEIGYVDGLTSSAQTQITNLTNGTTTFTGSVTLPAFTDFGTHDLGADQGWDTTANVYAGFITYTGDIGGGFLIDANSSQLVSIASNKLTLNSKVTVTIKDFSGTYGASGMPVMGSINNDGSSFTFKILNISATAIATNREITIQWWILN